MWIVFRYLKQKIIMEFSGDETLRDVKAIFCDVYGFHDKINFSNGEHLFPLKSYEKPLKDLPEFKDKDYVEIKIVDSEQNPTEKALLTGAVKLNKDIVIGLYKNPEKPISERSSSSSSGRRRSNLSLSLDKK